MSLMDGNPYATASKVSATEHEHDGDWGNTQAVMALAFEQRTANLIAYQALWNQIEDSRPTDEVDNEMAERLGLRERS